MKRKMSLMMLLLTLTTGIATPVYAQQTEEKTDTAWNGIQFSTYADRLFKSPYQSLSISPSYTGRIDNLTSNEAYIYSILQNAASEIADGKRSSSVIKFYANGITDADYSLTNVVHALLDDCPYEFYWYDKAGITSSSDPDDQGYITITLPVSRDYAVSGNSGTTEINTKKTQTARKAAEKAKSVADAAYDMDFYTALVYYRDYICSAVSYDYSSAGSYESYGDPWQIINVFDEDPDTNVVCEGYAKAFKYLSDLYLVAHPEYKNCDTYLVMGTLTPASGSGNHMWNIVRMNDGDNYVVDLTNCDAGTDRNNYFLTGGEDLQTMQYQGKTRTFSYRAGISRQLSYSYALYTGGTVQYPSLDDFSEDEIRLSSTSFDPTDAEFSFTDVKKNAYYYDAVKWAASKQNGISCGTSAVTFSPDQEITRGQFITWLYRYAGSPSVNVTDKFKDVSDHAFYAEAVSWAVKNGITSGTTETTFSPNQALNRAQAVTFLYKAFGEGTTYNGEAFSNFSDVADNAYYAKAVDWAVSKGITAGSTPTTFAPNDTCTRGQAVTYLYRV